MSLFEKLLDVVNKMIYKIPDNIQATVLNEIQKINNLSDQFDKEGAGGGGGQSTNRQSTLTRNSVAGPIPANTDEFVKKIKILEKALKDARAAVQQTESKNTQFLEKIEKYQQENKEISEQNKINIQLLNEKTQEQLLLNSNHQKLQSLMKNKENFIIQLQKQINQQNNQILMINNKIEQEQKNANNVTIMQYKEIEQQSNQLQEQLKQQQNYCQELISKTKQNEELYKEDLKQIIQKNVKNANNNQLLIQKLQQQINQLNNTIQRHQDVQQRHDGEKQILHQAVTNLKQQMMTTADNARKEAFQEALQKQEELMKQNQLTDEEREKIKLLDFKQQTINNLNNQLADSQLNIKKLQQLLEIKQNQSNLQINQRTQLENQIKSFQLKENETNKLLNNGQKNVSREYNMEKLVQNLENQLLQLQMVNEKLSIKIIELEKQIEHLKLNQNETLQKENQMLKQRLALQIISLNKKEQDELEKQIMDEMVKLNNRAKILEKMQ